ncbi:unnamed protein product [Dovyalis caffra]|uniref:Uncharacterized protein n=1 Tax=Dovyalis caffra TaxID=77055 RepID=A0AAV1QQZ5_9ROSI|nr:unnamed protein product [Dovyalis caffra]
MKGKEGLQLSRVEEVQFNSSDSDFEARPGEEASARALTMTTSSWDHIRGRKSECKKYGKVLNPLEEARYLITGTGSRVFPGERVTLPGAILSNPLVLELK